MESRTKNKQSRENIARMVNRAFDGVGLKPGEEAIIEHKEGWFNVVYSVWLEDGREVILKIAPPINAEVMTYEKNIMQTEVSAARLAGSLPGVPVPEIYYFDNARDLCDNDYFFMQKLRGENLEHVKAAGIPQEKKDAIDFRIGEIVRQINTIQGEYFGYPGNDTLRAATWAEAFYKIVDSILVDGRVKGAEYGYSEGAIRAMFEKHAGVLDEVRTPVLVHWDAWDLNFFTENGEVTGLLDFERALWADPLMEAQFRPFFGPVPTASMRGYGKLSLSPAEEIRSQLYTLHLALVMNTESYYRHYDTDDVYNISLQIIAGSMEWLATH